MASTESHEHPHPWPYHLGGPALISDPIVQCLVLIVLTTVVFLVFPGIDPWFSGLFYIEGQGFPVSRLPAFTAFRDILRDLTWIVPVALVLALLVKLAIPWRKSLFALRDTLFILSTLAIGPGIVSNLIFKNNWGRPRPRMTDIFQGQFPFVGIWQITDYCQTNCSFVSGEASTSVWLLTLAVLFPLAWRGTAIKVLSVLGILLSLNRIAFGGHYLSDVLFAWWINLAIITALYRLIYVHPPAFLTEARLDAIVGHAGSAIRRLFSPGKR